MASTTIDAHSSDGSTRRVSSTSWVDCETGAGTATATDLRCRVYWDGAVYWTCYRGGLAFDLTGLPSGFMVTDADIIMKVEARSSVDAPIMMHTWTETGTPSLGADDYDDWNTVVSIKETTPAVDSWHTVELLSAGINYINAQTEDYAYFMFREYHYDYFSGSPSAADYYSNYHNSGDTGEEPYLSLTYYIINDGSSTHYSRIILTDVIGDWKFNDGGGSTVTDDSDQSNNGTKDANITWETNGAEEGGWELVTGESCLKWVDDDTGDAVQLPTDYADLVRYGFSISAWILQTSDQSIYAHGRPVFSTRDWDSTPENNRGISFGDEHGSSDDFSMVLWDSNGNSMGESISGFYNNYGDKWTHMVMVFDPNNGELKGYINNILEFTDNTDPVTHTEQGAVNAKIGSRADTTAQMFDGYINQVKLYNYALDTGEIDTLYSEGRELINYLDEHYSEILMTGMSDSQHHSKIILTDVIGDWKMNDGSGDTVTDDSDQSNNGTRSDVNITWETSGTEEGGWELVSGESCLKWVDDNTGDKIQFSTNFESLIKYGFSISLWILQTSAPIYGGGRPIFMTYDYDPDPANKRGFLIGSTGATDGLQFSVYDSSGTVMYYPINNFYATYGDKWVHYVGVFDPAVGELKVYRDNSLEGVDSTDPITHLAGGLNAKIGQSTNNSISMFDGYINQVKLYNYALDTGEIDTLYSEGRELINYLDEHYSEIDLIEDNIHYSQIRMLDIDAIDYPSEAGTGDGMVEVIDASWSTAWNQSDGDSFDTSSTTHMIGGIYLGGDYYIRRYMAYFSTASIPDNAIVTHVELDIYVHSKAGDGITWYCTAWTDGYPITVGDYDGFGSTLFGSVAAPSIGWKTMTFNSDGEDYINLTGDTELFLRGEHDYNNDTPTDGTNSFLRTGNYTDYEPILTVSYYLINDDTHYSQIDMVAASTHYSEIDLWTESTHHSYIDLCTEQYHQSKIIMTSIGDSQHYSEIYIHTESVHYSQVYVDNWDSAHYSKIDVIPFSIEAQITNKNYIFDELITILPRWLQPEEGMNDQIIMQALSEEMFLLIEFAEYVRDLSDIDSMRMYSGSGDLTRNEALNDWSTLLNRERAPWETDEDLRTRMNDYAETFHEAGTLYRYRDAIDDFFALVGSKTDIKMWEPTNTNAIASQSLFVDNHDYISYFDSHPEHFIYCPNGDGKQRIKYYWVDETASGEGQWHPFILPDARNFATVALTIPTAESSSLSGASGTTEGIEYDKSNTPFIRVIDTASGDLADGVYYNAAGDQYYVWDVLGMEDNFAFRLTHRRDILPYDVDTFIFFTDTDDSIHYSDNIMTGLIAEYKLNEGSGNPQDTSIFDNHGTLNDAEWVTENGINCLYFDGIDDGINCTNNIEDGDSLSISMWIKFAGEMPTWQMIISRGYVDVWAIARHGTTIDKLRMYIKTSNGQTSMDSSWAGIEEDTWYHIIMTYDHTTGNFKGYVDTIERLSKIWSGKIVKDTGQSLTIGIHNNETWYDTYGHISDVKIYSRPLTSGEISDLYTAGRNQLIYEQAHYSEIEMTI